MDVLESSRMANDNGEPAAWVVALAEWIARDAHPRFIVNSQLACLWLNDSAQRMVSEGSIILDRPTAAPLSFFDRQRLKALLKDAEDGLVHWSAILGHSGEELIVWAKAIGEGHDRLFGLVLMPPDRKQNFQEFFENARLTPAEARTIDAILRGISLANAAAASGVSKETIKTQLKNAYRKLSVTSRGELFAEAHKFLAP